MNKKNLLSVLVCLLCSQAIEAQTWDGSSSTDWNTAANWSTNAVPVAAGNVIIPGGLANYPQFASNVSIARIDLQEGSQLDVNGFTLTITASADFTYFTGTTLNNSNAATDIVVNIATAAGYHTYIRQSTFNDNITFNLTGLAGLYEADNANTGNNFTGNITLNFGSTGVLNMGSNDTTRYDGNLLITRTAAGTTTAFGYGAVIGGNFAYTNATSGSSIFGAVARRTSIAGTINVSINNTATSNFEMMRLINGTGGGSINVQNSLGFDLRNDTLLVNTVNITGYRGAAFGYLYNNDITGNMTIADDATHGSGYHTYIRANLITGNAAFTTNSATSIYEADNSNAGNHYTGNVNFSATGTGNMYISSSDTSRFDGNLVISRTGAGVTDAFNSGAVIGGNFSFTNNSGGGSLFGAAAGRTSIAGTVNITINHTTDAPFEMIRVINGLGGGVINVQNSRGFDLRNDTLIVNSVSITGYRGADFGYFYNNSITGNVTIADDASHASGYHTYIRENLVTGNAAFTTNSNTNIYEADNASSGNQYTGNVSFSATSIGSLVLGNNDTSRYGGNVIINRTGAGITDIFNSGAVIQGNFAFTNNTAGNSLFGSVANRTSIGGTVNIAINDTLPGSFEIMRFINATPGGAINVQNTRGFDLRNDTLQVSALSITGYTGADFGYFYNNSITGNVIIADDESHGAGYHTYIRENLVTGNAAFTTNSNTNIYEADNASSGNQYTGNVSFSATSIGSLVMGNNDTSRYGGNVIINRTGAGITDIFNSGAVIQGNFAFTNNTAGNSLFGSVANRTSIGGTVNIAINDTVPGSFEIMRFINATPGGAINVQNTRGFDFRNDTLLVSAVNITGYRGADFGYFYNNDVTANVNIADDATHSAGYHTYVRENLITGNTALTTNSTTNLYEADNAGAGNRYIGNLTLVRNGGSIFIGQTDTSEVSQNLTLNAASNVAINKIKLNGSGNGVIEQLSTQPIQVAELILEKSGTGKITLNDSVIIATSLLFNGGVIESDPVNKLVFNDNATHTGSSDQSHVNGYVSKIGDDVFTFPIGTANTLNAVSMTAPAVGSVFNAQYFPEPASSIGNIELRAPTLQRVSDCEYWNVSRTSGASNVALTFQFGDPCASGPQYISNPAQAGIAHWTGSIWENLGNGGSTGTTSGTITTAGPVTNINATNFFTLGSTNAVTNPLPVQLIYFTSTQQQGTVSLQWKTSNEINFARFELQKSTDGSNFSLLSTHTGNNIPGDHHYNSVDEAPVSGVNYYRLKMVDLDGNSKYSEVLQEVITNTRAITIFPNPATDQIRIISPNKIISIEISDVSGRLLKRMPASLVNHYSLSDLKGGIYIIKVVDDVKITTARIIKQ